MSSNGHILYEREDPDAPDAIKDSNGDIALAQCAICKKAEGELDDVCLDDSVTRRERLERLKAGRKYKKIGLLPGGDPERDIFDYAINELVGLIRYAEMIENRAMDLWAAHRDKMSDDLVGSFEDCAFSMKYDAAANADILIQLRAELLKLNLNLGKPESR